jgi:hypothetical protein
MHRAAVGREPHDLILAFVDLEAEILREDRIEQTERMREMNRLLFRKPVAFAEIDGRGLIFADPVERHHHRALERRCEKRRGRMRKMMLGELDLAGIVEV